MYLYIYVLIICFILKLLFLSGINTSSEIDLTPPKMQLFPRFDWEEPVTEDLEITISPKAVRKNKIKVTKINIQNSAPFKKIKGKSRLSLDFTVLKNQSRPSIEKLYGNSRLSLDPNLVKNPFQTKKVKINTKLNMSQEFHEHHKLILNSPGIPYDANKKPLKPLLKTPVKSTPINPFYNSRI